jgi:CRP-like cAMP-binding protein
MVSPELLRRFKFFGFMTDGQLKAVAMIAEEAVVEQGEMLFAIGEPARALYLLTDGGVELNYVVTDEFDPQLRKEFYLSDISPGEMCGISALIEPYQYTSSARAASRSRVIRIDSSALQALCEVDPKLAYGLMRQTARVAVERLHDTRVQLAAARA